MAIQSFPTRRSINANGSRYRLNRRALSHREPNRVHGCSSRIYPTCLYAWLNQFDGYVEGRAKSAGDRSVARFRSIDPESKIGTMDNGRSAWFHRERWITNALSPLINPLRRLSFASINAFVIVTNKIISNFVNMWQGNIYIRFLVLCIYNDNWTIVWWSYPVIIKLKKYLSFIIYLCENVSFIY